MNRLTIVFAAACCSIFAETVAITNGRVYPVSSPAVDGATVIITDGKITAVGTKIAIPKGARRIDATGLSVYPGWIDGWTRVGMSEIPLGASGTVDTTEVGNFSPYAQAWIAVNPHSEMIKTARVNGVTSALVAPAGGRISGVASAMNLFGNYPNEMALLKNAGLVVNMPGDSGGRRGGGDGPGGGAEAAGGESAARRRAEDMEKLRQYMREAKRYAEMRARGNTPASAIETGLEAMLPVLRGERPIIVPADTYRDIKTAVDFANEFNLKLVIAGGADAWKHAELLAKNKVAVLYAAMHELPRSPEDPYDVLFSAPEVLRRAGVKFVGSSRVDLQACKLEYSIVSPK